METNRTDALSASRYPLDAGFKSNGTSQYAATQVDRDPKRKLHTYTLIGVLAILYPPMVPDVLAERIGEHHLYTRPRVTQLCHLGVTVYGAKERSPTCGRLAQTVEPAPALVEFISKHEPDDVPALERLVRAFVLDRLAQAAIAKRNAQRGNHA